MTFADLLIMFAIILDLSFLFQADFKNSILQDRLSPSTCLITRQIMHIQLVAQKTINLYNDQPKGALLHFQNIHFTVRLPGSSPDFLLYQESKGCICFLVYSVKILYYYRRMSHFIENTYDLQSEPVLKPINKQIVVPPLSTFKHGPSEACDRQSEKMLKLMFYQLQNSELERMRQQNAIQLRKQFQQLRAKLARKAKYETVQKAIDKSPRLPKLELSQIIKMSPQKIDLLKKHRSYIQGKIAVFHQAENISRQKEQYQQWYDSTKNSPLKSPIYTKMNYLLQRVTNKQAAAQPGIRRGQLNLRRGQLNLSQGNLALSQSRSNPVLARKIK